MVCHIGERLESMNCQRLLPTTIHVVRAIEWALEIKQYPMTPYLDIEAAFNTMTSLAIQKALSDLNVEESINDWLVTILNIRIFTTDLGTPHVGVIWPLLCPDVLNSIHIYLNLNLECLKNVLLSVSFRCVF